MESTMSLNPGIDGSSAISDESQSDKITRLAKEALDSDDVQATRAFLEEVNKVPDKKALAAEIKADQTGLIDGPIHYFSDDPTVSFEESGDWQKMTFKVDGKEIHWNTHAKDLSELSDEQLARYEKDSGAEAINIVQLAKQAIDTGDVQDTRNFIQAINNAQTRPIDLATIIQADQTGLIDGIGHAFSSNPSISWDWDSNPMGRWASEIKFKLDETEVSWSPHLRNEAEMSDRDVSRYRIDYAELRRQGEEMARQAKLLAEQAVEEVGEMSALADTVLQNPDSAEAKQALLVALKKTEPLKTSMAIDEFESSRRGRSEPDIDISWGAHPMGDWIKHINFKGSGRQITWKPGDENIEVKPLTSDT